ncbi:SurA N-terminal domain-containing protein [Zophobihabitans entericus]|uniref:Periplasmic chaperone PpiD n=1 Tax=Zophobihabitans entericus TaxID=1635327 RepID=A0A6G9I9X8_9GAMM|nr:SurA N-terminal domain-containing protein [Zophobihabitans entericus]QIQ20632.1 hypothetical protein IPMB12_02385 [Zophobihabitans entericus]
MMEKIRVAANHLVVKIIFAVIILSFIFAGVGGIFSFDSSENDANMYIAKVNGEGISRQAFENQARAAVDRAASLNLTGNSSSFERDIRRGVLGQQIDNYLAYQFSNEVDAKISNDQVKDAIRQQTVFFENGRFSNRVYLEVLAANGYTPEIYGNALRTEIQQKQVMNALVTSDFTLPVDENIALLDNQVRSGYIATVTPDIVNLDDVEITEEDALNYYNTNQDLFKHPERAKIKFIANFRPDIDFAAESMVTEADAKAYYEANKTTYTAPEQRAFSIIYTADIETANDVYAALQQGKNFDELAKETAGSSVYGAHNGSLGWFTVDGNLPSILVSANLTKKGEYSKPVQEDDGSAAIVRLDDIKKPEAQPFAHVKADITKQLIAEKAEQVFTANNAKLVEALANNPESIEALAQTTGLPLLDSDWNTRNERFSLARFPEVRDVLFDSSMIDEGKPTGSLSDIIYVDQVASTYVIQVTAYEPEGFEAFDSVKESIIAQLKDSTAKERFATAVKELVANLQNGTNKLNVSFGQRFSVNRSSDSLDKDVVNMIFTLVPSATGNSVYGAAISKDNVATIAAMTKVETPEITEESSAMSEKLLSQRMQDTIYFLSNDLRSKAKIEIMPNANM